MSYIRVLDTGNGIRLIARVGNAGQISVLAGVGVTFYNNNPALSTTILL